ncbi:molybdopterin dinucleotide binding domain-containing protein [Nocardioides convexus]|uniref:molybdopterin oxidoreductase family protein n=1 Tax=Nocardioides convexus TaxID=2712224 RepID=UPI0024184480|nr:molybdopterin dinucleotide binding domain-containing protein [Nocardioides convexus]
MVLPAATWGEKTGTFTNVDRTVHLSEKAVDPPGEARPDLDILLDYARRLDLRDKDGAPLVKWSTPEEAFEAWKECTRGRPCDYTGITYDKAPAVAAASSGPATTSTPTAPSASTSTGRSGPIRTTARAYGRDLVTGAPVEPTEYKALNPHGKAVIKAAEYLPPRELPSEEHPFQLITGRTLYHFHTRTKTGRAPRLQAAAPEVWVEASATDSTEQGWEEGDLLHITTPRGAVTARLRVSGIRPGVLFLPFHYGYWDTAAGHEPDGQGRAANEPDPDRLGPGLQAADLQDRGGSRHPDRRCGRHAGAGAHDHRVATGLDLGATNPWGPDGAGH